MAQWPNYKSGDWLAICDSCGVKYKASELKKRWDGLMVCPKDFEPRQPQDFVRARSDQQAVRWSRPEAADVFIPVPALAIAGSAIAGIAIASSSIGPGTVPPGTFTP